MDDTQRDDSQRQPKGTFTPYGEWPSPVSAEDLARASRPLQAVAIDAGRAVWAERRPTEEGRTALMAHDGAKVFDLLDERANARTTAHEYGGGAFTIRDGVVWYAHYADQRLYRRDPDGSATALTPEPPSRWAHRYADLHLSPDSRTLLAVREVHDDGAVSHDIVALPADGGQVQVLVSGHDFFAAPRVSPDGRHLAWITWDHPHMPWDSAQLWVAELSGGGIGAEQLVAGGADEAPQQPTWAPDGSLWFVNDPGGWWNLFRRNTDGSVEQMTDQQVEYGWPLWQFGTQTFGFLHDGRVVAIVNDAGVQHLVTIEPGSAPSSASLTLTAIAPRLATDGRNVVVIGGTPTEPMGVVRWDPDTGQVSTLRREFEFDLHPDHISVPRAIEFPTGGGLTAHAFHYAPRNADVGMVERDDEMPTELPPLIVRSHGGPTAQFPAAFSLETQFWTTRGFAVVDVNYGGSTGYGREYRERLRGAWGTVDVEDCINAARFLADSGLVDPDRMAIRGGSAGGFTTLAAVTFHDVFAAGACYYGVADIKLLAEDTHDFESRYMDSLVGPLPADEALYQARSPLHHAQRCTTPLVLFQGLEDKVVPPEHSEKMAEALADRGVPHAYIPFEGEQHGFRRADSIVTALKSELAFYGQIMGFSPPGVQPVELGGVSSG